MAPVTRKKSAKLGRPKQWDARLCFSLLSAQERLVRKWCKSDGTDVSTLLRELIEREDLRRRGVIVVLHNGRA